MDIERLFNLDDPASIISVVPSVLRGKILALQEQHPELLEMSEDELRLKLWGHKTPPPVTLNMIRLNFWIEYHQSQSRPTKNFFIDRAYLAVCSPPYFYKMVNNPPMLAWMLCEPTSYAASVTEGLSRAVEEMRAILDLPTVDLNGRPNKTVIEAKIKVFALLDARKNGAFTQKIENKNLNLSADMKDIKQITDAMTDEDLEKRIALLEKRVPSNPSRPDITVEVEEYAPGPDALAEN